MLKKKSESNRTIGRRRFLRAASLAVTAPVAALPEEPSRWDPVEPPPSGVDRVWIGPAFWANRLQDWRLARGRIECATARQGEELRTLAVLPREIHPAKGAAHLSVKVSRVEGRHGFCGFLIGAGGGKLDWRAAALVQRASGEGGGLLCVWESDGTLAFREHIDEARFQAYAKRNTAGQRGSASQDSEVELRLAISRAAAGKVTLTLTALDAGGRELAAAVLPDVDASLATGGFLLASSRLDADPGARYAFRELRTAGGGVSSHADRSVGPIAGTLYSLNEGVLKLSAQLFPIGEADPREATLEAFSGGQWRRAAAAPVEDGYLALFRVTGWDASRDQRYRVRYGDAAYEGTVRRDPAGDPQWAIAMINCVSPVARNLDGGAPQTPLPGAGSLGRYTPDCLAFPFTALTTAAAAHRPALLVFSGDQIYEGRPTRTDPGESPTLDYLYKWYLWHWAFRGLTANIPAIVQVDDHDVYQGNIWGQGGRAAPDGDQNRGGYVRRPAWVNMVQRTQCGHNPDPYDPTPIEQGISVYYGGFRFGGVSFAILEDRKFKTGQALDAGVDVSQAEQLGKRQESFLAEWAKDRRRPGEPKICLTQTTFACVQTAPDGQPREDRDSNGYPKHARDRSLRLIREAGALILSGDQHLTHLVRHGLDGPADGPLQFTAPAGASLFARWFEPAAELPSASGKHTGDFTDGFGNRYRVLAVANPDISFAEYRRHRPERGQGIEDPRLRADGYGIIRVDTKARQFVIECWPSGTNRRHPANRQFPGWPVRLKFDKAGKI